LVCGGRDYNDNERVKRVLDKLLIRYSGSGGLTIIQGEALGADTLARQWAEDNTVPTIGFRADWKTYGKRAGYIRNSQMLTEGHPDLVIAFPGGNGTDMMIKLAKAANISVVEIKDE
jgi:hypothetical protein